MTAHVASRFHSSHARRRDLAIRRRSGPRVEGRHGCATARQSIPRPERGSAPRCPSSWPDLRGARECRRGCRRPSRPVRRRVCGELPARMPLPDRRPSRRNRGRPVDRRISGRKSFENRSTVTEERQDYDESSAVGGLFGDNGPAVAHDDLASDGQAQTGSSGSSTS